MYVRGSDFSPVAVAVVLNCDADKRENNLAGHQSLGGTAG